MFIRRIHIRKFRILYGILVIIVGWLIGNIKHIPFMHNIFYPEYCTALKAQEQLYRQLPVRIGDRGFREVAQFLETKYGISDIEYIIPGQLEPRIYPNKIKIIEIVLDIAYAKTERISVQIDLKNELSNVYLDRNYFMYSLFIFSTGVVISLYPAFRTRKEDRV